MEDDFDYITDALWKPRLEPSTLFDAGFLDGVDRELVKLWEKIKSHSPLDEIHTMVTDLCDSVTLRRDGEGKNVLLYAGWRETWDNAQGVHWALFREVVGLKDRSEARYFYRRNTSAV
jgi:hypothetical protein